MKNQHLMEIGLTYAYVVFGFRHFSICTALLTTFFFNLLTSKDS